LDKKMKSSSSSLLQIIFVIASIIIAISTILEFGTFITKAQQDQTQLSPEQKAAMCKPNDSNVNITESHVCGIPPTLPSANATAGAEAPPSPPSATPAANATTGAEAASSSSGTIPALP
jgi:hypothetical protein